MRELKTTKMEWIPVEDGLPPEHVEGDGAKYYLVRYVEYYPHFGQGILINGEWHSNFANKYVTKITHWCDVP